MLFPVKSLPARGQRLLLFFTTFCYDTILTP